MGEVRKVDIKKIEALRLDMGSTKKQFYKQAGITHQTYNKLLDGADRIRDDVVIKIAEALAVKPSELIYWEEAKA